MVESDIELVVKLLEYAKRRINWAYQQSDSAGYYEGLTDGEYQALTDNIQDLEGRLMAVICVQDIVDSIDALSSCVCAMSTTLQTERARLPEMGPYIDDGKVTLDRPDQTLGAPTEPGDDDEKCELAQAIYLKVFQAETEVLLPFANDVADVLVTALVGLTAFEALAGFVGLPLAVLTGIVSAVVAWGVDGSIANFTNWLIANKDELVCELYNNLPDYDAAAAAVASYIDSAEEITFLDKHVLKSMIASTWWMTWIALDQQTNGTWDDYFVAGQCDDCEPVDEQCDDMLPCDTGVWYQVPAGSVTCAAGIPQVINALASYRRETIVIPAALCDVTVRFQLDHATLPTGDVKFEIREAEHDHYVLLENMTGVPTGVPQEEVWSRTFTYPGDHAQLQVSWYGYKVSLFEFCVHEHVA